MTDDLAKKAWTDLARSALWDTHREVGPRAVLLFDVGRAVALATDGPGVKP